MDAFWSQETRTVSGNVRRLRREYFGSVEALSIRRPVPIISTNKFRDRVGMGCVIQTLDALQIKGKWQDWIQWDLMWRALTWYNNSWEAGAGYLEAGAIHSEIDKKVYESTATTASRWFSRFMLGAKRRMGVVNRQDGELAVHQLLFIGDTAEEDWSKSNSE